ncbi:transposase family protein [Salimicrobium sp. PL1-032A]|uniref:transposase family protein n=1 Tax=Salimicrobium sp. PL1-032A TaxID=3095364 RepID=UPI0032617270
MNTLFRPLDTNLQILNHSETPTSFLIVIAKETKSSCCPLCQRSSERKHSSYMRIIHDLPIQGKPVLLYLRTQKWFCTNVDCKRRVFTERYPWLLPSKRRTKRLEEMLRTIAFSNNCVQASLLCQKLGIDVSHDTLLRLVHHTEIPVECSPFCRH